MTTKDHGVAHGSDPSDLVRQGSQELTQGVASAGQRGGRCMNGPTLAAVLQRYRFNWTNEEDLQIALAQALRVDDWPVLAEYDLGIHGRVDFFLDGLAIEVKTQGSRAAVLRQLHRYAEHDDVTELLLVTTSLKLDVPPTLNGKPVTICRLPRL